jgi:hypothetical protein
LGWDFLLILSNTILILNIFLEEHLPRIAVATNNTYAVYCGRIYFNKKELENYD